MTQLPRNDKSCSTKNLNNMTQTEAQAKANFGETTVDAMHELAELIFISRSLRDMKHELKQLTNDDLDDVKPIADQILKTVAGASIDLLKAIGLGKTQEHLQRLLQKVRVNNTRAMVEAAREAPQLVELERTALRDTPAKGNVLFRQVQQPLERLARAWKNVPNSDA